MLSVEFIIINVFYIVLIIILLVINNKKANKLYNQLFDLEIRYSSLESANHFISKDNVEQKAYIANLEQERNLLGSECILLKKQVEDSNDKYNEWQKLKNESVEFAKSAFLNASKELSKELIEGYKKESIDLKNYNEQSVLKVTEKLNQDFVKISESVSLLNDQVKKSTSNIDIFKKALMTPGGMGATSEITLENILKSQGLISGVDFFIQYHANFAAGRFRPDAVVMLPAGNVMVIDSKSSIFVFDEEEIDNTEKLVNSMNMHVKSLSSKDYKQAVRDSLDKISKEPANNINIMMFVISETVLEKVHKQDKDFMVNAWEQGIYPIGPIGLVNILSYAKFMIGEHKKAYYADQILTEVGKLISSISVLYDHAKKLGTSIKSTAQNFDKFAASFNSNLIYRTENISKMGIESKKQSKKELLLERFQLMSLDQQKEIDQVPEDTQALIEEERIES